MEYHLRIARRRPEGGVDTESVFFEAEEEEDAINHAFELTEQLLGGQPRVGVLSDPGWGIVWSHRHDMPAPPLR